MSQTLLHPGTAQPSGFCEPTPTSGDCTSRLMLHTPEHVTTRTHARPCRPPRIAPRRAPAPAAGLRRADADRARGRAVLEGVRLADRARQDAADARDDRMARGAARRRRVVPRERRLDRRARARRGDPHPRGGAVERRDFDEAIEEYTDALAAVVATGAVDLQVRVLSGEAWARAHRGEVRPAIDLLEQARGARRRARSSPTSTAPRSCSASASAAT